MLQREIEARSQRIHAHWHQWRAEARAPADREPARPWRKLIVVCAKLPYTFIWDEEWSSSCRILPRTPWREEKHLLRVEHDEFEPNFAEILAKEIADHKARSRLRGAIAGA